MKKIKSLLFILVVSIVITMVFSFAFGSGNFSLINFLVNVCYGIIIGGSISMAGYLSRFIVKRFDVQRNPVKVYVILLVVLFLYITIDVFVINVFWFRYVFHISFENLFLGSSFIITTLVTIFIGLTIFFIVLSRTYMQKFTEAQKETQEAIVEADMAKFETLKSQINPHFLFNSLNALSTLIHVDTQKADEFISKLSGIYRYVLNHQDSDLVPVENELMFAKDFANLQAVRFGNNFTLDIHDFNGSKNVMIIPLSLQLLLENVFKHNIISQNRKVHISISFERNYVVVSNNKTMVKEVKVSHAVGLSNIMNRYALVCDDQCVIEDAKEHFTVKLPLVDVE